ncbi:MAG: hypothetical protein FJ387_26625 [Verrucomicrobia bacterium]|nr:hypothetical protein [Verrucomicrobiota bacterium]
MRPSKTINAIAATVTVAAAGLLYLSAFELPARPRPEPHRANGWVMAQTALRHLGPDGLLVVIRRDTDAFPHPEADLQFAGFEKAVRQAQARIHTVQALQVDPLRPLEVPAGDFYELIRKAPAGSVIVSLMGPPLLSPEQRRQLGEVKSHILAFCPGALPEQIDLRILIHAGVLHTAVISRPQPRQAAPKPRTVQDWFDREYQLVTASNVDALYQPAQARH